MLRPTLRSLATCLALALLAGCATPPAEPPAPEPVAQTPAPEIPERTIPDDSVFPLLLAEFAMRRRAYDVSLQQYLEQAPVLRDPGVSAHTTRLAQYLQKDMAALEAALLWAELEPDNAEANNTAAGLLVRQNRTTEAVPYLVAVERSAGNANFPVLVSNYTGLSLEEQQTLGDELLALSGEFPDSINLLLAQALVLTEDGKPNKARAKLDRILAQEPQQQQALLLEGKILADQGAPQPYARIEDVLQDNPEDTLLRMRYARLLTGSDMEAARTQFEILSAQSPEDADLLFSLALINREIGDQLAASAYLKQVIELGERVPESYYYLGRIAEERERPEEAIEYYGQVRGGAEYMAAVSRVGELLGESGQLERMADFYDEQRDESPNRTVQLYGIESDLLARHGTTQQAMALLDRALEELPDAYSLRYTRAMLFEQEGDLATMETELRAILDRDPANATALNALGYTLANRTDRHEEALELIQRALELEPGEPAILDSMGWVLFRLGRYEESLDYLTRAYQQFPDPEVAAHLGEVLWTTGDTDAALQVWRSAFLKDATHPVLLETLKRLDVDPADIDPRNQPPS